LNVFYIFELNSTENNPTIINCYTKGKNRWSRLREMHIFESKPSEDNSIVIKKEIIVQEE